MKHTLVLFIALTRLLALPVKDNPRLKSHSNIFAFVNVNVIPMDSERVIEGQTIIVHNGIIDAIGKVDEIPIPEDAMIINGDGKYLLPGLTDMHVHIQNTNDLLLFIAHGVTTVRNMWGFRGLPRLMGFPDQKKLRDRINSGELLGPTIYTSGPILEGKPRKQPFMTQIITDAEAEKAVKKQVERGYDFIKVYDNLTTETFDMIISAASKPRLQVAGHVPKRVGLNHVLKSGQVTIEHLTGFIDPDAAEFIIPEDSIQFYAEMSREVGVWNCPTYVVWQKVVPVDRFEEMADHPGMQYMSWTGKLFLRKSLIEMNKNIVFQGSGYHKKLLEISNQMVEALHQAGANIILGTDAGNPFVFPGYSVHEELQYLVNAGLTPYEAIKTGTVNAAECLNKNSEFGTLEVGKRADLILIKENPLKDVKNIKKRVGVMVRGKWFSSDELNKMLEELAN